MPISFHKRAGELPADASLGNWPIVLCLGLAWETYRRIKARLGRFEVHVRRGPQGQQAIGLPGKTRPDAIIIPFGELEAGQDAARRLRREAAGLGIPILFVADRSAGDDFEQVRRYDGPESLNQPILLADLSGQLAQYIPLRERFCGIDPETLCSAGLCEVYRAACQSDFYG
jgi:hypothetical protein